jgi:dUTP pyrophosphatase
MSIPVRIKFLPHGAGLPLPDYATGGAAGMDIRAAVQKPVSIPPMGRALIPTGFAIALPPGYELQIRPRSGLALKHGIVLPNAPGTIDEDYRGEVQIILMNASDEHFLVTPGMRIAQAVLAPVVKVAWDRRLRQHRTLNSTLPHLSQNGNRPGK